MGNGTLANMMHKDLILTGESGETFRSIEAITTDVHYYTEQAVKSIWHIGKCLIEAKAQLSHGEWLPWLRDKAGFGERQAQTYMQLAREYSNPQLVADLGERKAMALTALAPEVREEFIETAKVHEISAREAEEAVRRETEKKRIAELRKRRAAIEAALVPPGLQRAMDEKRLPLDVAEKVSRQHPSEQYKYMDYQIDKHQPHSIQLFKRFKKVSGLLRTCPETGRICEIAEQQCDLYLKNGNLEGCAGCCKSCLVISTCPIVCKYAKPKDEPKPQAVQSTGELMGQRLKELREKAGMEKKLFAAKLGVYPSTYSAWENGDTPASSRLPDLARALGCTTDYLLGLSDSPISTSSPWYTLEEEHWPEDGQMVLLAHLNVLGGIEYQAAKCCGGTYDGNPHVSALRPQSRPCPRDGGAGCGGKFD